MMVQDGGAHRRSGSPLLCSILCCLSSLFLVRSCHSNPTYNHQELIGIGFQAKTEITSAFSRTHNIPPEMARPPGAPWIVVGPGGHRRRRRERKQKRRCQVGLLARLRKQPYRPLLPSIFLTNARSLVNEMDELQSQIAYKCLIHECCLLIVSESWLRPHILDATVEQAGCTLHRYDWTKGSLRQTPQKPTSPTTH